MTAEKCDSKKDCCITLIMVNAFFHHFAGKE